MTEELTVEEINERYPKACVLIVDPVKDAQFRLLRGRVAGAGTDRSTALQHIIFVPSGHEVAIHFTDRPTPNGQMYLL